MLAPVVKAAGVSAGAQILSGVFGRSSAKKARRRQEARDDTRIQRAVTDAKAAGLHPLFAMGAAGAGSTSFQIPGQSSSGSVATDALGKFMSTKIQSDAENATNLVNAQAALSAVELARHSLSNDAAQGMTLPLHRPAFTEIQKGRTDVHYTKNPEQSLNVKSPMTQVRIGSQSVWVPVEEVDEFMENPLAVGGLTYIYHGNSKVDWGRLLKEYTGKPSIMETMRKNIRKHVPVRVRKKHLLKKFAKPFRGGPSP